MPPKLINTILLDRYQVTDFIAAGGMGAVYRVYDQKRSAYLAMKILHEDISQDPAFLRRFQRQAASQEKLTHPNIVPFYGFYLADEFVFLLQAYIDGSSLKEILDQRRGKPFSTQETLTWVKSLQAALGYAHSKNVIHCDVKPGNVMVDDGGRIYLTDFGIARDVSGADARAAGTTMAFAGSPGYMAPEQIRNEAPSPATDVYALGVLLFEMLTGTRPFLGNEPGSETAGDSTHQRILYAHLHLPPPDPRSRNPALSPDLAAVVLQALQKDPGKRFASTHALYAALLGALGVQSEDVPDRWMGIAADRAPAGATIVEPAARAPAARAPSKATVIEAPHTEAPASPHASQEQPRRKNRLLYFAAGFAALCALLVVGWLGWSYLTGTGLFIPQEPSDASAAYTPTAALTDEVSGNALAETELTAPTPTPLEPSVTPTKSETMIGENPSEVIPTESPTPGSPTPGSPTATKAQEPTPTPDDPRKTPAVYSPLANCAPSRLKPGMWTYISYGGGQNAIRSDPDLHASDNWTGVAREGEMLLITGGPECSYRWIVWEVLTAGGLSGWTPESDGEEFWLEPFPTWNACKDAPASTLLKGERAVVAFYPDSANKLRQSPGRDSPESGKIYPGEVVQVLDGPTCADGFAWWLVRSTDGKTEGWTAEGRQGESWLMRVVNR